MIDRRALILGTGGLGASLGLGGISVAGRGDLFDLAEGLRGGGPDEAFHGAEAAIKRGATPEELLGAVFLIGVCDVKPRHVGGKLHCVMMVNSAFQLTEALGPRDRYLAALWNLNDLKVSQARDKREHGDWKLSPAPKAQRLDPAVAAKNMRQAMDRWDEDGADQAVVDLAAAADRDFTMGVLWPYAARHFASIGHNIIYAAQVDRTLARIGWEYAVPALRSLVYGLLNQPSGKQTGAWAAAGEALAHLPEDWPVGDPDQAKSEALANGLVGASREEALALMIAAAAGGAGQRAAWDAAALAASQIVLARSASQVGTSAALLTVHGLTENEAFRHAAGRTQDESLRRRLLLQSVAWLVDVRDFLTGRGLLQDPLPGFARDKDAAGPKTLDALWQEPTPLAAQRALERRPEWLAPFERHMQRSHFFGAQEHHQPKYAAAALSLSKQVAPGLAPRILAPMLPYLPSATVPSTDVAKRSLAALDRAQVR